MNRDAPAVTAAGPMVQARGLGGYGDGTGGAASLLVLVEGRARAPYGDAARRSMLIALWSRRRWILLGAAPVALAAACLAFLTTPTYRASVTLVPVLMDRDAQLLGLMSSQLQVSDLLTGGGTIGSADAQIEEALAVLRSRSFTERFIADRNLLSQMFPGKQPSLALAARYFDKRIRSVLQDRKTGLVTLRIDWRDPATAAQWANELVTRLNAQMRDRAIRDADASLDALKKALRDTSEVEVRDSINSLIEARLTQRMLATAMREFPFRVIDPALPADPDNPLWPKRGLLVSAGALLGLLAAALVVLLRQMVASPGTNMEQA